MSSNPSDIRAAKSDPVPDLRGSVAKLNRRAQAAESVLQALVAYADSIRPFGSDPFLRIVGDAREVLDAVRKGG